MFTIENKAYRPTEINPGNLFIDCLDEKYSFLNPAHSFYKAKLVKKSQEKIFGDRSPFNNYKWRFSHFGIFPPKDDMSKYFYQENAATGRIQHQPDFCYALRRQEYTTVLNVEIKKHWINSNNRFENFSSGEFRDLKILLSREEISYKYNYDRIVARIKEMFQISNRDWRSGKNPSEKELLHTLSTLNLSTEDYQIIKGCVDKLNLSRRLIKSLEGRIKYFIGRLLKHFRDLRVIFKRHHSFHFKNLDDYHIALDVKSVYIKV